MKQKFGFVNVSGNSRSAISLILASMQTMHLQYQWRPGRLSQLQPLVTISTTAWPFHPLRRCYSQRPTRTLGHGQDHARKCFINQFLLSVGSGETVTLHLLSISVYGVHVDAIQMPPVRDPQREKSLFVAGLWAPA